MPRRGVSIPQPRGVGVIPAAVRFTPTELPAGVRSQRFFLANGVYPGVAAHLLEPLATAGVSDDPAIEAVTLVDPPDIFTLCAEVLDDVDLSSES